MTRTLTLTLLVALTGIQAALIPNEQEKDPNIFFRNYMGEKLMYELEYNNMPTLKESRLVFTDSAAGIVYKGLIEMKARMTSPTERKRDEAYKNYTLQQFSSDDVQAEKGNYPGILNELKSFLQPGITFYMIEFQRVHENEEELGEASYCWVYLEGKWVYFSKFWMAFRQ